MGIVLGRFRAETARRLAGAWRLWCAFWFGSPAPERMRLFRLALGTLLFFVYLARTPDLELYFSDSGIMPLSAVSSMLDMEHRHSLLFHLTGREALWALHALFLSSLACLALGIAANFSALAAYVLHLSFLHRDMAPTYGVDLIATFFLLYLIFADYRRASGRAEGAWRQLRSAVGSVAFRLLQLQVCIVYAYSGLDKARGTQWWGGEALWGVMANAQLARFDFSFVAQFPLAVVAATYVTLAWEIYFPVLIWFQRFRTVVLAFGVALHLGIAFFVNIAFFGFLLIVSYALFLDEAQARRAQILAK